MRQGLPFSEIDENKASEAYVPADKTAAESMSASYDEAWNESFIMSHLRQSTIKDASTKGSMLSAHEANRQFPGLEKPFRHAVSSVEAQLVSDRNSERQKRMKAISEGPQNAGMTALNFGAGAVAHMMDPVEFGLGWVSGAAVGKMIPALSKSLVARDIVGNVAENALAEGMTAGAAGADRQEYNSVDFMMNVAMGSFLMPGMKAAFRGAKIGVEVGHNRFKEFLGSKSPETQGRFTKFAVDTFYQGKTPDINRFKKAVVDESDFSADEGMRAHGETYTHTPVTLKDGLVPEGKEFHISVKDTSDLSTAVDSTETVGKGFQATDDIVKAHALVNSSLETSTGKVVTVKLKPDAKVLAHSDNVDFDFKSGDVDLKGMKVGDALETLRTKIEDGEIEAKEMGRFTDEIETKGYSAIMDDGTKSFGEKTNASNRLHVLNENSFDRVKETDVDTNVRKAAKTDDISEAEDMFRDNKKISEFESKYMNESKVIDEQGLELDKATDEAIEELESAKNQGFLDEAEVKEFEAIKTRIVKLDEAEEVSKVAKVCVGL